jgi:hypothetical protein
MKKRMRESIHTSVQDEEHRRRQDRLLREKRRKYFALIPCYEYHLYSSEDWMPGYIHVYEGEIFKEPPEGIQ